MFNRFRIVILLALGLIFLTESSFAVSVSDKRNAKRLYERITGVKINSTQPMLLEVADLLAKGDKQGAVKKITSSPDFINVQIRNLGLRLSNKDESVKVPFNDFAALIVGAVRDNRDFREVLTGDFYYDVTGQVGSDDARTRYFAQTPYVNVDVNYGDLTRSLVMRPKQKMAINGAATTIPVGNVTGSLITEVDNTDAAGVLSTRTFAEKNFSGGTNRRAVEFTLKQFLCVSMAEAADSNASDQFVGKDVERFPAGDHNKYLTSCKSCHAVMDGMRPAFAKQEYVRYTSANATSFYSNLSGDVYIENDAEAARTEYINKVYVPIRDSIIPDLQTRQEESTYYKTRYDYMVRMGTTPEGAREILGRILNTIRDPALLNTQVTNYRTKNAAALKSIRDRIADAAIINLYSTNCIAHLNNTNLGPVAQESRFLICDIDRRKETSLIYNFYSSEMIAAKVAETERTRLLKKMINEGRPNVTNIIEPYLQATKVSRTFPNNAFDTETGVATKMNKGSYTYGFTVRNDQFVNNANLGNKAGFFGWRGPNQAGGSGLKEFGRMIADSRRFSQCMAKRAFESVCSKKLDNTQVSTLARLGDRFEALNYNLRNFYGDVALDEACGILQKEASL